MSYQLKMTVVQSTLTLHAQLWSQRHIAETLGIDRGTVGRHLRRAAQASPPAAAGASNAAIAPTGSLPLAGSPQLAGAGCPSRAEPWREWILASHAQGLTAIRIHQDLVAELGAQDVSYDSVRRLLNRLPAERSLPMRRMECEPGHEVQVDFGPGARIPTPEGKRRRTHVLRVVLSHSRKVYSEACYRQTSEDFLRVLENTFWQFGGVPRTVVVDNLTAAVQHPDWYDPELNPKLQSFAQHCGTVILPTKPRMPRHKGQGRTGGRLCSGQRPEGERVQLAGRTEPASGRLGTTRGRHADSWHHEAARGPGLPRSRAGHPAAVASRAISVLPRSGTECES